MNIYSFYSFSGRPVIDRAAFFFCSLLLCFLWFILLNFPLFLRRKWGYPAIESSLCFILIPPVGSLFCTNSYLVSLFLWRFYGIVHKLYANNQICIPFSIQLHYNDKAATKNDSVVTIAGHLLSGAPHDAFGGACLYRTPRVSAATGRLSCPCTVPTPLTLSIRADGGPI